MPSSNLSLAKDCRAGTERALYKLNYRLPEHPPDIYYIRRDPDLVKRFLNRQDEYNELIQRAHPNYRAGYRLFSLTPHDMNFREASKQFKVTDPAQAFDKKSVLGKERRLKERNKTEQIDEDGIGLSGPGLPFQKVKTTEEILKRFSQRRDSSSKLYSLHHQHMQISDPSIERLIKQQNFWIQEGSPLPSEREHRNGSPLNRNSKDESSLQENSIAARRSDGPKIRSIDQASPFSRDKKRAKLPP